MRDDKRDIILVTGGSGFIGTHLVKSYKDMGREVINIDIASPLDPGQEDVWVNQDLLDRSGLIDCVKRISPTIVIHLAARTDLDESAKEEDYAINIDGVSNLIDAVEQAGTIDRMIITSSMLVCEVGYTPKSDTDYRVSTVYGRSKVLTETITRKKDPSCTWMIARPATIWGPYHEGLKKGFFSAVKKGLYFHPGRKSVIKSYGYVTNSVSQLQKLAESDASLVHRKTFYISDPPMDLRLWVGEVSKALVGRDVRIVPRWIMWVGAYFGDLLQFLGMKSVPLTSFRLKNMTTENIVDVGPIIDVTGGVPVTMEQGVKETVLWLSSQDGF